MRSLLLNRSAKFSLVLGMLLLFAVFLLLNSRFLMYGIQQWIDTVTYSLQAADRQALNLLNHN